MTIKIKLALIVLSYIVGVLSAVLFMGYTNKPIVTNKITETNGLYLIAKNKLTDLQLTNYWSHDLSTDNHEIDPLINFANRASSIDTDGFGHHGEILYKGVCDVSIATLMWHGSPIHAVIMHDQRYKQMVMISGEMNDGSGLCYIVGEYRR